jgi:nicotinate-nucleotide adenylyltransferase
VTARIGVFGGTFDPIHNGHLVTAVNVHHELGLDRTLLVPAGEPWQKSGRRIAPGADRLAMVQAAIAGIDGLEACDIEVRRSGPSYTADTLAELRAGDPDAELFVVVGSDVAALLETWERAEEVQEVATLVMVVRPGSEAETPPAGWRHVTVEIPQLEIGSSEVRERLCDGRPIQFLVPREVWELIEARGLYR